MKLSKFNKIFFLIFLFSFSLNSQNFSDQGMYSGSSIILLPTGSVAPSGNFRINLNNLTFFKNHSISSVDITGGLSSHMEMYFRYSSEVNRYIIPTSVTVVGGKFLMPLRIPIIYRAAIWGEVIRSPISEKISMFPANLARFGSVVSLFTNNIEPTLFLGFNKINRNINLLSSISTLYIVNDATKLGIEFSYGYFGNHDYTGLIGVTRRVFSNMSLQLTTGYIVGHTIQSWVVSLGISLTTEKIDFSPRKEQEIKGHVPSFDEIMKSIEEQKTEVKKE